MPRIKTAADDHARAISAEVATVLATVSPIELCTYRVGSRDRAWQTGVYFDAERRYPIPPLRAHAPHVERACADCADFVRWRQRYEAWITANGAAQLPEMVAPSGLAGPVLDGLNPWNMSPGQWVGLVALMVEAALGEGEHLQS